LYGVAGVATEHVAMLIHPSSRVFDRPADPGYVLSEMKEHCVGEREPELGQRRFLRHEKTMRNGSGTGKYLLDSCWTFVCK
jgi:hypothetical protein